MNDSKQTIPPIFLRALHRGQVRMFMYVFLILLGCSLTRSLSHAQAALQAPAPSGPPPTLEEVRRAMGIPSHGDVRGQQDAVGYASTAVQMEKTWELSAMPPAPEKLGEAPPPGVAGVICPHDDYIYAGRVYRGVLPLVTAKTVILVGVFHGWRKFAAHDVLVFDDYRAWRTPDGEVPVSGLRTEILARLGDGEYVQNDAWHDSEHSLEALLFWLRHARPDLEIVPVILPVMHFSRMDTLATHLGAAIAAVTARHGLLLAKDFAIAISSDAVHYGNDFQYTAFGEGGVDAYVKACDQDKELLRGPLAGEVTTAKAERFFAACVMEAQPGEYRLPWCGRYSIPFGLLLLQHMTAALGVPTPVGRPLCYGTSIGGPELKVRELGMGSTAQANLYHFVGYPAVAYTVGPPR
jgi:AmmeMemoRadiSam system protein B